MIDSFRDENRFLSNFYPAEVEFDGIRFPSVEHAYQWAKNPTQTFADQILSGNESDAKRLGNNVRLPDDWEERKLGIMWHLLQQKFKLDSPLGDKLLATGNQELVEGNWWHDTFWGRCHGRCRKGHPTPEGENHLGRLLMQLRDELRLEKELRGEVPRVEKDLVLFTGSRKWKDEQRVRERLQEHDPASTIILHGDAPNGLDRIVDRLARILGFEVKPWPANWAEFDEAAGAIRNQEMVDLGPKYHHAFLRPDSKGTKDCVARCKHKKIPGTEDWEG